MAHSLMVCTVDVHQLAAIVRNRIDNALVLDSRSFLEYNACHVINAINVGCAKLMKRRLQQEKLSIKDFLAQNCHWEVDKSIDIIVYDQNSRDAKCLPPDSFMAVFLQKLLPVYNSVNILKGGFLEFQAAYPNLCEDERTKFAPLTSLSQPCLPVTNHGPTRILPFLYLGSQQDALNKEALQHHNITYQLNVSTSCPKPDFIQDSHFMRIPVIDNYSEKLLPHFSKAFQFLDKVRESGGCVLVHCLAGISRSATVAIAYVMKCLKMNSDEAYRYVKAKRATISPNFNFLGQLLEFEKQLQRDCILERKCDSTSTHLFNPPSPSCHQQCKNNFYDADNSCLCSASKRQSSSILEYTSETKLLSTKAISHCVETTVSKEHLMNFEQTMCKKQEISSITSDKQSSSLNIKCLPISYLKEISFTPCQTFAFKTECIMNEKNIKSTSKSVISSVTSPTKLEIHFANSLKKMGRKNDSGFSDIMSECRMDTSRNHTYSSDVHSPPELKQFDFESKPYSRSDSVSTSGLGSEGSDCADSWNEFTSSCERESDILMDDDYPTHIVPSADEELRRNKILGFEDSYDDCLTMYPKYEFSFKCHPQQQYAKSYSQMAPGNNVANHEIKCENSAKYSGQGMICHLHAVTTAPYDKDVGRTHLLYRAQSCPGMLTTETSESCAPNAACSGSSSVKLRKSKHDKYSMDKCRNRYSCSSIDYMDYSMNHGVSHVSCPESLPLSGSDSSTLASSHCNYRHSMIQVS